MSIKNTYKIITYPDNSFVGQDALGVFATNALNQALIFSDNSPIQMKKAKQIIEDNPQSKLTLRNLVWKLK